MKRVQEKKIFLNAHYDYNEGYVEHRDDDVDDDNDNIGCHAVVKLCEIAKPLISHHYIVYAQSMMRTIMNLLKNLFLIFSFLLSSFLIFVKHPPCKPACRACDLLLCSNSEDK